MRILAVETSSKVGSVALLEDDQVVMELSQKLERQFSSHLVPMIHQILTMAGWTLPQLDGYAVGLGPGSFTGLRVGITTIKGLALVDKKPVVGISSLLALACNGLGANGAVAPLVDAKRNLVYFAWYHPGKNGRPIPLISPSLGTLQEALSKMSRPTLFIGDAVGIYQKQIRQMKGRKACFNPLIDSFPRASFIGKMALEKFRNGKVELAKNLAPQYLYSRYCSIQGNR